MLSGLLKAGADWSNDHKANGARKDIFVFGYRVTWLREKEVSHQSYNKAAKNKNKTKKLKRDKGEKLFMSGNAEKQGSRQKKVKKTKTKQTGGWLRKGAKASDTKVTGKKEKAKNGGKKGAEKKGRRKRRNQKKRRRVRAKRAPRSDRSIRIAEGNIQTL